jgi:hypothetical protein
LREPSAASTLLSTFPWEAWFTGLGPGVAATSIWVSTWNTILYPLPIS